jgi:hypothetical protein
MVLTDFNHIYAAAYDCTLASATEHLDGVFEDDLSLKASRVWLVTN